MVSVRGLESPSFILLMLAVLLAAVLTVLSVLVALFVVTARLALDPRLVLLLGLKTRGPPVVLLFLWA